jgi:hypothetical protein
MIAPFGGGVVELSGVAGERRHRRGERDLAVVRDLALLGDLLLGGLTQVRHGGQRRVERRPEVHVEDEIEHLVRHVVERLVPRDARVVHHDVELAELLHGRAHQAASGGEVHGVGDADARLTPGLDDQLGGLVRWVAVHVVDHHPGTVGRQPYRGGPADPPAGARDDGDPVRQPSHSRPTPAPSGPPVGRCDLAERGR